LNIPRGVNGREFIRALETDGFVKIRTEGSHRYFKHPDGRRVTVSCHKER
jgi:predicted RNA binding protein YcfA (HicA-like mRNA interferase family)